MAERPLESIEKSESNDIHPVASKEEGIQRHPNPIVEERYRVILSYYMIRQSNLRKYGLFQPDFLWKIIGPMLRRPRCHRTDEDMKGAVREWCADPVTAEAKYGKISNWDTSSITDMSFMFCGDEYDEHYVPGAESFNEDINRWNTAAVPI